MKLLKFPYLVQKEILKQMRYGDLFLLSLTSKRVTNLIKSIDWKEIVQLDCFFDTSFFFNVCFKNNENDLVVVCEQNDEHYQENPVETVKIKIDGMLMDLGLEDCTLVKPEVEYPPSIILEDFKKKEEIETVCNRLYALFGRKKTFRLMTTDVGFLPNVPKIVRSDIYHLQRSSYYEDSVFEEYFARLPIQERIYLKFLEFRVTRNSKFYQSHVLIMEHCGKMAIGVLLNFKGRGVYLYTAEIRDDYLMRFLKRWKYKKAFHNLRILEILYFELRNFERIQRELQFKTFPGGENQSIIRPISRDVPFSVTGPTQFQTYIVREDGIVAYILLDETRVFFHVQEFTEEQMKAELAQY